MDGIIPQLKKIPQRNFYWADRYDTENEYVLHLWDDKTGESWDIRIPKKWKAIKICASCGQGIGRSHKFKRVNGELIHRNCNNPESYK